MLTMVVCALCWKIKLNEKVFKLSYLEVGYTREVLSINGSVGCHPYMAQVLVEATYDMTLT